MPGHAHAILRWLCIELRVCFGVAGVCRVALVRYGEQRCGLNSALHENTHYPIIANTEYNTRKVPAFGKCNITQNKK